MPGRPRKRGSRELAPAGGPDEGENQNKPPGLNNFRTLLVGGLGGVRRNALQLMND